MTLPKRLRLGIAAMAAVSVPLMMAADHADGSAATADPAADITDIFAWMSADATHVNLVMDVFPFATGTAQFSDAVQYVFHTRSKQSFTATAETPVDVICTFDTAQKISCWANGSFVTGDASNTNGITSGDGKMKVFAGLRDDPFFFNLDGFKATAADVAAAAPTLTFDPAGCPALDTATVNALVTQLSHAPDGGPPQDHFAHKNVLAIVISLDKTLVNQGGPIIDVWGSTYR
jgi:hypothetical protein